ncbi:MAG: pyrroline-5-carboxylate reductase [Candidatus Nitrospinota bacterium M3_3B_026]
MLKDKKITVIGSGFMGGSLVRGLVKSGAAEAANVMAADSRPEPLEKLASELGVRTSTDNAEAAAFGDIVILAVKPGTAPAVAAEAEPSLGREKLVISVAAGVSLSSLSSWLPAGARIVRAMPNVAAAVGQSATAFCAGGAADEADAELAREVFEAVGTAVETPEGLMDAVTGLSGSGPAFVFTFLEGMIDAGVRCGLARDAAAALAVQTLNGAARLAMETGKSPSALKETITSPGGTTIAGLAVLEEAGFRGIIMRAVEAAVERSRQLGKGQTGKGRD